MSTDVSTGTQAAPISIGDWLITILITAIPIVGLVMLFVWAFGSNANVSKANWAKATLIWYAVAIVLCILFVGALLSFIAGITHGTQS